MIIHSSIAELLSQFKPIELSEMERVKLLNRIDSKYMFSIHLLPEILSECKKEYSVVNINGKRYSSYKTLYYDTPQFDLYNQHHSGKLNRYKIRKRTYVESDLSFLEIKFKSNKGRTDKNRIKVKDNVFDDEAATFLQNITSMSINDLKPNVLIEYNRITLVNNTYPERITIDLNLTFSYQDQKRSFNNLVIAEVKQDKLAQSVFVDLMKAHRIKEGAVSKYCMAVSQLIKSVKNNNFKEKNRKIEKIIQE